MVLGLVMLSACAPPPMEAGCVAIDAVVPGGEAGCAPAARELVMHNVCAVDATITAASSRTAQLVTTQPLPFTIPSRTSAAFAVTTQSVDGGLSEHPVDLDFADGTRLTPVVSINAPPRARRWQTFVLRRTMDLIVLSDGTFTNAELASHFDTALRYWAGSPDRRVHLVSAASRSQFDLDDTSADAQALLAGVTTVDSPLDRVDAVLPELNLQPNSEVHVVVFTDGADAALTTFARVQQKLTAFGANESTLWLVVRGGTCPAALAPHYELARSVFDACDGADEQALLSLERAHSPRSPLIFVTDDVFRPGLTVTADGAVTTQWWVQSGPQGELLELWPSILDGANVVTVDSELRSSCELGGG